MLQTIPRYKIDHKSHSLAKRWGIWIGCDDIFLFLHLAHPGSLAKAAGMFPRYLRKHIMSPLPDNTQQPQAFPISVMGRRCVLLCDPCLHTARTKHTQATPRPPSPPGKSTSCAGYDPTGSAQFYFWAEFTAAAGQLSLPTVWPFPISNQGTYQIPGNLENVSMLKFEMP